MRKPAKKKTQSKLNIKFILINAALIVVVFILLIFLMSHYLKWYTDHGESLTVPDFRGMSIEEAQALVDSKNLRFEVKDSMFVLDKPKLSILEQMPKANSKVKEGRRIYFIINAERAPKVAVPQLVNVRRKQAVRILESYGLKEGKVEYKPDIALNAVLEMKYNGRVIEPGIMIDKGSAIDLVLGDGGLSGAPTPVPNLKGHVLDEAKLILAGSSLNLGATIYTGVITDTLNAIIYKQRPLPDGKISMGEAVDVWLSNSPNNLDDDTDF